jgi:hypothetical protein
MRVAIIPSDKAACAMYRLAWPANAVAEQAGWQVEIHDPADVTIRPPFVIKGIDDVEGLDVVVMQRIATPRQVRLVSAFQKLGIAVVIDVDDMLSDIERDNGSHAYWNEEFHGTPRYRLLEQATRNADLVTVSTPTLARKYAKHGRVEVLRNGLPNHAFADPTEVYDRRAKDHDEFVVGWSGSLSSHPHDLEVMGGAVRRAMDADARIRFHVVGDAQPVAQALNLDPSRVTGTGWVPFEEYHVALRDIDLALVPLIDSRFNRAKSHLKALEFSAAGSMVLTSPLPEQVHLAETIPTGIAHTEQEWENVIIGASALDQYVAERIAQDRVEVLHRTAQWAIANRAGEWVSAWQRAIDRRKNLDS